MTAWLKSPTEEFNLAQAIGVAPKEVIKHLVVELGQKVKKGELVAENNKLLKKKAFFAPVTGYLNSLTEDGILLISLPVKKRTRTVKPPALSQSEVILATMGIGEPVLGKLDCVKDDLNLFRLSPKYQGLVLAVSGSIGKAWWHKARCLGVKGVICGGFDEPEIVGEIEKEILLVNGRAQNLIMPVIVLGKTGTIPSSSWQQLEKQQGKEVFLHPGKKRILIPH